MPPGAAGGVWGRGCRRAGGCFLPLMSMQYLFFFFQAEDGIRDIGVTGVQTCALPISRRPLGAGTGGECHGRRGHALGGPDAARLHARYLLGDPPAGGWLAVLPEPAPADRKSVV